MSKEIKLTGGYTTIVDDQDFDDLNKFRWFYSCGYARRDPQINKIKNRVYLHRQVLGLSSNLGDVDHINGNKLDNRRSNLRLCTHQNNIRNQAIRSNNKSGYKGVSWDKSRNLWESRIYYKNKLLSLGRFKNAVDAAKVYNKASLNYFGEFSRINII